MGMSSDKPKPVAQISLTVYLLEDDTFGKSVQMRALGDWSDYRPFRDMLYSCLLKAATEVICLQMNRKTKEGNRDGEHFQENKSK